MSLQSRLSLFFIYAGVLGIMFFVVTMGTRDPNSLLLCLGLGVVTFGIFLRQRVKRAVTPPPEGDRKSAGAASGGPPPAAGKKR